MISRRFIWGSISAILIAIAALGPYSLALKVDPPAAAEPGTGPDLSPDIAGQRLAGDGDLGGYPGPSRSNDFVRLAAGDGSVGDAFGWSVAIDEDRVVVGAYGADIDGAADQGAAYVFERDPSGADSWIQVARLIAEDGRADDWFGYTVGVSGDAIIVGAHRHDVDGVADKGAAYVFERSPCVVDEWLLTSKLTVHGSDSSKWFGKSVAIRGLTALVGADGDASRGSESGAAYVFGRTGDGATVWNQTAKLVPFDTVANDSLGHSVALGDDGKIAVIGAPGQDVAGESSGAAYTYWRLGGTLDGEWQIAQKLTAPDGAAGDRFGNTIDTSGDLLLIGAPMHDGACPSDPNCNSGAAYVFADSGGYVVNWSYGAKITSPDPAEGDGFGQGLAVHGRFSLVGAPLRDAFLTPNCGEAYGTQSVDGGAGVWQTAEMVGQGLSSEDNFGSAVDLSTTATVVGACECGQSTPDGPGMAFVWSRERGDPIYLPINGTGGGRR